MSSWRTISLVLLLGGPGCLSGAPNKSNDGGVSAASVYFDPDIQSTMDIIGCSSGDCHGANDTPMHVVPPAQGGSVDANYAEVRARTGGGTMSLLLTKPVTGNSVTHEGGKLIAANSATFNQWAAWINAGAPLRAPGTSAPPTTTTGTAGDMAMPPAQPTGDMGACVPLKETTKSSHNRGQECLRCHATGQDPLLRWTVAGTLWSDSFGVTPKAGATVTVVDAKGVTVQMTTDVEGNFYTLQPVTFPISASASGCPSTRGMVQKVNAGGCNAVGCHDGARPTVLP
jgi:hypothetical protein